MIANRSAWAVSRHSSTATTFPVDQGLGVAHDMPIWCRRARVGQSLVNLGPKPCIISLGYRGQSGRQSAFFGDARKQDMYGIRDSEADTGELFVTGRSRPRGGFFVEGDEVAQVFDAEGSERQDFLASDAVDPEDAVLGFHVETDLVQQILVLTEHLGDAGDGEDGADRGHVRRLVPGEPRWRPSSRAGVRAGG